MQTAYRGLLAGLFISLLATACGGGGGGGGSATADTTPNAFAFVDQTDVPASTEITSAPVTISGIDATAPVSIVGGTYAIGCGTSFSSNAGQVSNNQTICVRHVSAAVAGATTSTTLTVGGVSDTFSSAVAKEFTVAGTITAASGSVADSDVNDPNAPYTPNDFTDTAQTIANPATVGGYVNQPGRGEPGRSRVAGDISDIYRVTLTGSQVITLSIADAIAGDADLFLADEVGNPVASSEGLGATETVAVTASGTYFIQVYAFDGASNYILTVGQSINTAAFPSLSLHSEFVPGEAIARFDSASKGAQGLGTKLSAMGMQIAGRDAAAITGPVLIKLDETNPAAAKATTVAATLEEVLPLGIAGNTVLERKWRTLRAIKQLSKQPGVRYAEPNYLLRSSAVPNDPGFSLQWHYPLINLPQAWDITTGTGTGVVAVIDTGVLLNHPDLQGQFVNGYDFISDPSNARDGDGLDPDPNDPGDAAAAGSSSFHGTHVAGTIGAATNNVTGVSGAAWNTRIMPLRVLGINGGSNNDVNQAILYAARLPNSSGSLPAQRADIINMSLGGPNFSQAQQEVITRARNEGVIIFAAAGNEALEGNAVSYPAAYSGVVSVGAVAIDKTRAPYSCFNAFVDIAAPGGNTGRDQNGDGYADGVLSTLGDDSNGAVRFNYGVFQGTSMATPHVAGVAALMKAVNPSLTPAQFDGYLLSGQLTQDLGTPGRDDHFGHGLVDAYAAVLAAQASPTPVPAMLVATPGGLNYDTQSTNATLSLVNGGGGSLTVTSVSDDATWLIVGAAPNPATGLGTRTVTVNRAGLAVGTYSASITVNSTANTVTIPVIMQVSDSVVEAEVGFIYVLLLDPLTGETLYDAQLQARDGEYRFSIPNVSAGSYTVLAGTDYNNDFFICDPGEACGGYPTLDSFSTLEVNGDVSGVDFGTGLRTVILSQSANTGSGGNYQRLTDKRAER